MKRYSTSRSISMALILLLVAFFSRNYSVEGRSRLMMESSAQRVRGLMKEVKTLRGEKDSFRKIPWSGSNPIQNKSDQHIDVEGSRKQHKIKAATKP